MNRNVVEDPAVIVALDFDDITPAKNLIKQLNPSDCRLKVGKQMFTSFGPDWVRYIVDQGFDVFLDLKFHDIPNTVAKAISASSKLGVWMVNVHASGGPNMIQAAKEATLSVTNPPLLTAVTVLTSMDEQQFAAVYQGGNIEEKVNQLALLSEQSGADGVVCSAKESIALRALVQPAFKLVTPGIRPLGSGANDQKRIMTPTDAINAGVDYLVIGRPITQSTEPAQVLKAINESLQNS